MAGIAGAVIAALTVILVTVLLLGAISHAVQWAF